MWADPEAALQQARATDSGGAVSRTDSAERADAVPVVGGEGHAELSKSLEDGMLEEELARSAVSEGPEPMLETPAYPPPLADDAEDPDLLGNEDDPDDDSDLDDETLDLALSVIEDIEARLSKLEDQAAQ